MVPKSSGRRRKSKNLIKIEKMLRNSIFLLEIFYLTLLIGLLGQIPIIMSASAKQLLSNSDSTMENDTEFATPIQNGKRFENPPSFNNWHGLPSASDAFKFFFRETNHENVPTDPKVLDETIPVHNLTTFKAQNPNSNLFATWLGHATVLVQLEGATLITDPIWSSRASFSSFIGPKRYRPPPMKIEDVPAIDFGVISHDHYDHLDIEAVMKLNKKNPSMRWFVPMGMKSWLSSYMSTENTTEMSWGENVDVELNGKKYTIWCLPAQHWGRRGAFDQNKRLWSGWALVGPTKRFYYTGDTGNCDKEFKKIGEKLGPIDLAAIPIGAYAPRFFMCSQHIDPQEAVGVHELIRSKMSLGIHWGTYHMGSYEYYLEPRDKLKEIMDSRQDLKDTKFVTINMGEIWEEE